MAPNLSGCLSCIKYALFVFNFLFWMVGCALVGVGIWVIIDSKRFLSSYNSNVSDEIKQAVGVIDEGIVQAAGIAIIVIGGAIMVSGFLGCCGAIRESQAMLAMFFALLFLIFAALVAIGIVAVVKRDWVKDILAKTLRMESNYDPNAPARVGNTLLGYGYKTYGCCGVDDIPYCDKNYPPYDKTAGYPCGLGKDTCRRGCLNILWGVMSDMAVGAGVAALVAGGLLILGMMFSMCLCCAIRQKTS